MLQTLPASFVILVASAGCKPGATKPQDRSAVAGSEAAAKAAVPNAENLADLTAKLDDVWKSEMSQVDAKFLPAADRALQLASKSDSKLKETLRANHAMISETSAAAMNAAVVLSTSTSADVSVLDHEAYVAYFNAMRWRIAARKVAADAMLRFEASPSRELKSSLIDAVKSIHEADAAFARLKAPKKGP